MSLRITGGLLRGRIIPSPDLSTTRPTTDMWRQAIFSALTHRMDLQGACVADLFAGTGILGFEALSRGAASVVSVEMSRKQSKAIASTARSLGIEEHLTVAEADVFQWLMLDQQPISIILADPPYSLRCANRLCSLISVAGILEEGGLLVIEHASTEAIIPHNDWTVVWNKEKGDTCVSILQWQPPSS